MEEVCKMKELLSVVIIVAVFIIAAIDTIRDLRKTKEYDE